MEKLIFCKKCSLENLLLCYVCVAYEFVLLFKSFGEER